MPLFASGYRSHLQPNDRYWALLLNERLMPISGMICGAIMAIWATIWATLCTARLAGLRPVARLIAARGPVVRWRGPALDQHAPARCAGFLRPCPLACLPW